MQTVKKILLVWIVLLGTMGAFDVGRTAALSPAADRESEPVRALWKHLSFRGSHFLGEATIEVSLTEVPAAVARKQLIAIPEGRPRPPAASNCPVLVIDVKSNADPLFGADEITGSRAWFSSVKAAALQRIRSRRGDEIWQNTYRFTQRGVYRIRKKPARSDEKKLEPAHWTKKKESFFSYPPVGPELETVLEPTAILYLAAYLDMRSPDSPRSLYVFDRKQLHEVTVEVEEHRSLKVSYVEKDRRKEIQRQGKTDAVRISFKPRALAPQGKKPEEFSFMGLKGDFEVYIDPVSRVPLQVSGQIPRIGKIHIRLHTVEY
jgi:hypothetical protein